MFSNRIYLSSYDIKTASKFEYVLLFVYYACKAANGFGSFTLN